MFGRGGGRGVCNFFLQGKCKFGGRLVAVDGKSFHRQMESELTPILDGCRNEHPPGQDNAQSQGGGGFGNRFAPLNNNNSNQGGARNRSGAFGPSSMSLPSHRSYLSFCFNVPAS
jgi:hypothetical protein